MLMHIHVLYIAHCIDYIVFVCAMIFNNVCSFFLLFGISFKMAQEEVLFSGQRQFCVSHTYTNHILREGERGGRKREREEGERERERERGGREREREEGGRERGGGREREGRREGD